MQYTRFIIANNDNHLYRHTTLSLQEFQEHMKQPIFTVPSSDGKILLRSDTVLAAWEITSDYKPIDS